MQKKKMKLRLFSVDQAALDFIGTLIDSGATFKATRDDDGRMLVTYSEPPEQILYS